jgi:hypothetical protein
MNMNLSVLQINGIFMKCEIPSTIWIEYSSFMEIMFRYNVRK